MQKKLAKREAIVQAAIEVFGKNSFRDSNIREIAKRANVAEGTIYKYFKDKEDLFFSIPVEKTKGYVKELDLHLQGITGAPNKIRKFIWYYIHFFKANPEYGRVILLEMRVSKRFIKTRTYNSLRKSTRQILDILKEGQEEGTIRKDVDIYLLRQLILGILEHVVSRWLLKEQKYDLLERHKGVGDLVLHGVLEPKFFKI